MYKLYIAREQAKEQAKKIYDSELPQQGGKMVVVSSGVYPKQGAQNRYSRLVSGIGGAYSFCVDSICRIEEAHARGDAPYSRPDSITIFAHHRGWEYRLHTFRTKVGWSEWSLTRSG